MGMPVPLKPPLPVFSPILNYFLIATLCLASRATQAAETVTATDYYNEGLDASFITGRADAQQMLDTVAAFSRTGAAFVALPATAATVKQAHLSFLHLDRIAFHQQLFLWVRIGCLPTVDHVTTGRLQL